MNYAEATHHRQRLGGCGGPGGSYTDRVTSKRDHDAEPSEPVLDATASESASDADASDVVTDSAADDVVPSDSTADSAADVAAPAGSTATSTSAPADSEDDAEAFMPTGRAWAIYTIVRIAAFVIIFVALYFALQPWRWAWLVALIVATLVGVLVSMIFLRDARMSIGSSIRAHREHRGDTRSRADRDEDELLDAAEREANAGRDD